VTSDQPPILDRAEMAVARRDFGERGDRLLWGRHDDFCLASFSYFSRRPPPFFSLLFSCPKWLVLFPVIYPKGSYFTDFIRQWLVVEVAGRQLFHVSLRIYLFFLSSSGF
jgi:hypothetical protein